MNLFRIACCVAFASLACAQEPFCKEMSYENHNQVDYGPLKVSAVKGIVQDKSGTPIPQATVIVFTEPDHSVVLSACTRADGHFELNGVKPGDYRLVVKYDSLCAANAKIRIGRAVGSKNSLVAKMRPAGIDDCSWIEAK